MTDIAAISAMSSQNFSGQVLVILPGSVGDLEALFNSLGIDSIPVIWYVMRDVILDSVMMQTTLAHITISFVWIFGLWS